MFLVCGDHTEEEYSPVGKHERYASSFIDLFQVLTLKCQEKLHLKMLSVSSAEYSCNCFQTYFCIQVNNVDPDQTAPRGAV